jgi:glycosyltransferase involved in cell wall biosynthesis
MKEKLLFLSPHLPTPSASEAGQASIFRDLEILSKKYEIHLIAFRNNVSQHWSVDASEVLCATTKIFNVTNFSRAASVLSNPGLPVMAAARASKQCAAYIRQLMEQHQFSRIHLEGQQMAVYAPLFGHISRRTLYAHDVFTQTFRRKADKYSFPRSLFYSVELRRLRQWERQVFRSVSDIYVPSEKDVALVCDLDSSLVAKTRYVQLFFRMYAARDTLPTGRTALVYWGAYSRIENVDAATCLVGDILPRLQASGHDVKVIIAGANPPRSFDAFDRKNVEITGFIEDPGDVLRAAIIAVLPLRMGGGVKIKVLELLSAGVPVVTTPVGAEGIPCGPAEGLIVTADSDPENIAKAASLLLSRSPEQLTALSNAAAQWARRYAASGNAALLE